MAECAGGGLMPAVEEDTPDSNQPLNHFVNRTAQGLIVVCVKAFLLLSLLGQFYFCAFQLLGHSGNVLLVHVCRH